MTATIIDVAKLCGYSKATVSRAFASPEAVSESARDKIYAAAKALDYSPNAIARAMARKRTDNIGFIIHEKQYPVIMNPFYSPIFETILQEGNKNGFSLFVSSDHDLRLPSGEMYVKKHLDGVILAGQTDVQVINNFRKQGISVVLLNNQIDMEGLLSITVDNFGGTVQAVRHLLERKHRKIGLIAGRFSPHIYSERYNGYIHTLKEAGIPIDLRFVQDVESSVEAAARCISSLLLLPECPTAFFCTNDSIAIGAVKAILRAGLRVPEDIAVVGFDDSDISRIIEPELTTVRIDKKLMGQLAAQNLFQLIEGKEPKQEVIKTPTTLIVRGST